MTPSTTNPPPTISAIEQTVTEEVNHWKSLDRKRKNRSFALFTKVSPLLQADDIMNSLQALSSTAQQELYVSGWNNKNLDEIRHETGQQAISTEIPLGSWSFPEVRGTHSGSKDIHDDYLPAKDSDLRQAMLGVAVMHLFWILGTVIMLAYLALHTSGGSAISTLFVVAGITLIVIAALKVNRYCLVAALCLMLSERRRREDAGSLGRGA